MRIHRVVSVLLRRLGAMGVANTLLLAGLLLLGPCASWAALPSAGTVVEARATAQYQVSGESENRLAYSNMVALTISAVEAFSLNGDAAVTRPTNSGSSIAQYLLRNTGNVSSSYTLGLSNGGDGCASSNLDIANLSVAVDSNGNGLRDATELATTSLTLAPGASATLLLVGSITQSTGVACV
ncbi:MAG: hypothetical protein ACR2I0_01230, partial [Rhodoferax sp.]